jgi:hypothetical protein
VSFQEVLRFSLFDRLLRLGVLSGSPPLLSRRARAPVWELDVPFCDSLSK